MNKTTTILSTALMIMGVGCASAQSTWEYSSEGDHIGRIYYYERSNLDGSLDERITMFRRSVDEIEVYKENGFCRNAALVTAELDFETFSADVITGGQLLPEAEVVQFAFLSWDKPQQQLNIRVQMPDVEIRDEAPILHPTWHLYDFDLASLTVMTPHLSEPHAGFSFGMALVWADASTTDPLTWMGDINADYVGSEMHEGEGVDVYILEGSALDGERSTGAEGRLLLDPDDGHIVDAILPVPSHPGYTDFRLRLLNVSDGGVEEWESLLRAHYEGCN